MSDLREELRAALELEDFPSRSLLPRTVAHLNRPRRILPRLAPALAVCIALAIIATLIADRLSKSPLPASTPTAVAVDHLVSYQFVSPTVGWVHLRPGPDVLAGTTDGGRTWHEVLRLSGLDYGAMMQWLNANDGVLIGQRSNAAIVWQTTDAGKHWTTEVVEAQVTQRSIVESGYFLDRLHGWVLVLIEPDVMCGGCFGQSPLIYRTQDGGAHWSQVGTVRVTGAKWQPQFFTPSRGVLTNVGAGPEPFEVTQDGGSTWQAAELPYQYPACPLQPPDCDFGIDVTHWFDTSGQGLLVITECFHPVQMRPRVSCQDFPFQPTARFLYKTVDGGLTWSIALDLPLTIGSVAVVDAQHFFDVGGATTSHTSDGGITWSVPEPSPVPAGWFPGTAVFTDVDHGFATASSSDAAAFQLQDPWSPIEVDPTARYSMFETTDAGAHWQPVRLPQV